MAASPTATVATRTKIAGTTRPTKGTNTTKTTKGAGTKAARGDASAPKADPYWQVLVQIIEAMEAGTIPWRKPWTGRPKSHSTGKDYQGTNRLVLSFQPFKCPFWATFNQIKKAGGSVRQGEHGCKVIILVDVPKDRKNGKDSEGSSRPLSAKDEARRREWAAKSVSEKDAPKVKRLLSYTVFNLEQTDLPWEAPPAPTFAPIEAAAAIVEGMPNPPEIVYGGFQAHYSPTSDRVVVPDQGQFSNGEDFYSTLFHELGHSTGHAKRLARPGIANFDHFGSGRYAAEELVAEITNAFLCGEAGIAPMTVSDSAAYISNWASRLRADPKILVSAASQAQKAADHILGRAPRSAEQKTDEAPKAEATEASAPVAPKGEETVTPSARPTPAPVSAPVTPPKPVIVGAYKDCQRCGRPLTSKTSNEAREHGYGDDCWNFEIHQPKPKVV